jgi:hypothetical protein
MKKLCMAKTSCMLILVLFCFLLVTGCSSDKGMQKTGGSDIGSGGGTLPEQSPSAVPAAKVQLWEGLKKVARKDYEVCLEHCGGEQSCLDRCASVYKTRLENDYKRVTQ